MHKKFVIFFYMIIFTASSSITSTFAESKTKKIENKKISRMLVVHKYGFNAWNTESSSCTKISKTQSREFKTCVSQNKVRYSNKRYLQFRCKTKQGSELVIYRTQRICQKVHAAMYLESF